MKVIIAGGRDFTKMGFLECKLDSFLHTTGGHEDITIVSGAAKGADTLAIQAAESRGLAVMKVIPNWAGYGKSAGYIRNAQMADIADALIAFWNGESRGTKHMIDTALKKGLEVHVYHYEKETADDT